MKQINIGFMASHGGSNMQAVLDAIIDKRLNAEPCVLISNNSKSVAVERAKRVGMPFYHLSNGNLSDMDLDLAILETLKKHMVEYLILVGYMKKLGPKTLKEYEGRIINIHPSLLPKYGGKGMFGKHVHEAVLNNYEEETGVTIHLVDEEYDNGKIINQGRVTVHNGDTVETLSERVLKKEHELLVETLIKLSNQEILL